jgi:hypothetical protein
MVLVAPLHAEERCDKTCSSQVVGTYTSHPCDLADKQLHITEFTFLTIEGSFNGNRFSTGYDERFRFVPEEGVTCSLEERRIVCEDLTRHCQSVFTR